MWVKHHLVDFIHVDNDQVLNHHLNTILVFTNHTRFRTSQLYVVSKVIYVSLQLSVQNVVSTQPCVGKLGISLVLLNFLGCNFRLWFKTP